jgi:methyltransferase (TIGR00027 family)
MMTESTVTVGAMLPTGESSQTAMTTAAARAAHLIVDGPPVIFADTLAGRLLGERADEFIDYHRRHGDHPILAGARAEVTCRSRYTEQRLADRVRAGVRQYVILGAGLDTFAYRSDLAAQLRIFEVDHPATQEWKRDRLAAAGLAVPANVSYVPADFEDGTGGVLARAGLDPSRPAVCNWLGVTLYLTRDAIEDTLAAIGRLPAGTEVIFDYMLPEELRDPAGQAYVEGVGPVAAQHGEPWLTFLRPDEVAGLLARHGLEVVQQAGQRDMVEAWLWERQDKLRPAALSQIARARVSSGPRSR